MARVINARNNNDMHRNNFCPLPLLVEKKNDGIIRITIKQMIHIDYLKQFLSLHDRKCRVSIYIIHIKHKKYIYIYACTYIEMKY